MDLVEVDPLSDQVTAISTLRLPESTVPLDAILKEPSRYTGLKTSVL